MLDKKYIFYFGVILLIVIAGCTTTEEKQITDSSLQDIKDKGTLVVGIDIPFGVMEFYDESGNLVGVDIDLAKEIASEIGVDLEHKNMPFDRIQGMHLVKLDGSETKYDVFLEAPTQGVILENVIFKYSSKIDNNLANNILVEAIKISDKFIVKE